MSRDVGEVSPERLMTTPPRFELSRLSRELYLDFLEQAKARGFAFVQFRDFAPGAGELPERFVLLRHDVDFAPAYSLELAELEHAAGVVSTYFVLADGRFYNLLDAEVVEQVRRIHSLGHEVGLHFAAAPADELALRLGILSEIVGAPVQSFAQHDPANAGFVTVELPGVDAYELIRQQDLLYVSDSAMMWREHTFESALEDGRNLCLLAHPHSWLHPEDDYVALVRGFQAREAQRIDDSFDEFAAALVGYYERRLARAR